METTNIKKTKHHNSLIHPDFFFFYLWFVFPSQSPEDSLKIQLRARKAYLLKNNLVPFIFVLLSFVQPEMIAMTDIASDLGFGLINDSAHHWRRERKPGR